MRRANSILAALRRQSVSSSASSGHWMQISFESSSRQSAGINVSTVAQRSAAEIVVKCLPLTWMMTELAGLADGVRNVRVILIGPLRSAKKTKLEKSQSADANNDCDP